ncbi:hypothetical protein [Mycoplasma sp. E35C]|uniref:hypothetical protein n=1 Tax=Mycoplasma sp. E35C TaxID=2801918 RepID=UPI001CA440D2|nr:hypothetical protein [Mycoplasma sp. E35C]QZX49404.1 hypothetical protein JJE79_01500 [Mycoplasma sp. E35C]
MSWFFQDYKENFTAREIIELETELGIRIKHVKEYRKKFNGINGFLTLFLAIKLVAMFFFLFWVAFFIKDKLYDYDSTFSIFIISAIIFSIVFIGGTILFCTIILSVYSKYWSYSSGRFWTDYIFKEFEGNTFYDDVRPTRLFIIGMSFAWLGIDLILILIGLNIASKNMKKYEQTLLEELSFKERSQTNYFRIYHSLYKKDYGCGKPDDDDIIESRKYQDMYQNRFWNRNFTKGDLDRFVQTNVINKNTIKS